MASFALALFKASILLGMLLNSIQRTNSIEAKGLLTPIPEIQKLIEFIKPYLQTIIEVSTQTKTEYEGHNNRRSESDILTVIRLKVEELKKFLEDDNYAEQDTRIVSPAIQRQRDTKSVAPFKNELKIYKLKRDKIKRMLHEQKVSNKTRALVMNTLDSVLALLNKNQCMWKSTNTLRLGLDSDIQEFGDSFKRLNESYGDNALFQSFYAQISNGSKYGIHCELVKKDDTSELFGKPNTDLKENITCKNFKLCSEELSKFMFDFYSKLNDTSVASIKNYAAMYKEDVNMENENDKKNVVTTINRIGDIAGRRIDSSFIRLLKNFTVDENKNKSANIIHLTKYVENTVADVKKCLVRRIEKELKTLHAVVREKVKDDLVKDLSAELVKTENKYKNIICSSFVTCNGKFRTIGREGSGDMEKGVFVKLEVAVDHNRNTNEVFRRKVMRRFNTPAQSTYNNIRITRTTSFKSIISNAINETISKV